MTDNGPLHERRTKFVASVVLIAALAALAFFGAERVAPLDTSGELPEPGVWSFDTVCVVLATVVVGGCLLHLVRSRARSGGDTGPSSQGGDQDE